GPRRGREHRGAQLGPRVRRRRGDHDRTDVAPAPRARPGVLRTAVRHAPPGRAPSGTTRRHTRELRVRRRRRTSQTGCLRRSVIMEEPLRTFIPVAGHDWLLALYDPLRKWMVGESLPR